MTTKTNQSALTIARAKLYSIAGGSHDDGDPRSSRLTTAQRIAYFRTPEFTNWLASEKQAGREVFWLKDVDKTQGAGDVFTFFFKWRADNGKFTAAQLMIIEQFMRKRTNLKRPLLTNLTPYALLEQWQSHEQGGEGIDMMEFWRVFWATQIGLSRAEKLAQVKAFAPVYRNKVYPDVFEENRLLTEIGVNVVIVSNGDQELAIAIAPMLGVPVENVVGSHLIYGKNGISTGVNHTYEVFGGDWMERPQPGKTLSFHYWLHANRRRFGWHRINEDRFTIGGRDGDSGSTDGGMMILGHAAAIGNFMVNTPDEPKRLEKFQQIADKYGWTCGNFITLDQEHSKTGFLPD